MATDYEPLARTIVELVGGARNIGSLTHCVTRLRFVLKDNGKVKTDELKATPGVAGLFNVAGQTQVIIGSHVTPVYDAVCKVAGITGAGAIDVDEGDEVPHVHQTPLQRFFAMMTAIFAPYLGVIAALGMFKGLLPLLSVAGVLPTDSSTYVILYSLADGFFYYMPILLAYTASKHFDLPVIEGLAIGAGMMYPSLLQASTAVHDSLFGIPVMMPPSGDYSTTAIPIIVAIAFAGWFEKRYKRFIPDKAKTFVVPLITCSVTFVLAILAVGPAVTALTNVLSAALTWLEHLNGIVYAAVLGGIWQLVLMAGVHFAVFPIVMGNLATIGFDTTLASTFGCNFAAIGAVLATRLRTKDENVQTNCIPSLFPAAAGVIEPALYGVTLRRRTTFVITCIVSGLTGIGMSLTGARAYRFAGFGIFGYSSYVNPATNDPTGLYWAVFWSIAAIVASFVLVFLSYTKKPSFRSKKAKAETEAAAA